MVLYEAITGRHWSILDRPEAANWSGIPRRIRRALRKALAWSPDDRFVDAATFERALWVPRPSQPFVWPATAIVGIAAAVVAAFVFCEPLGLCSRGYELVVEPFTAEGATVPRLGRDLATIVTDNLARFPQIRLVPKDLAFTRWEDSVAGREPPGLAVHSSVKGVVSHEDNHIIVRLEMRDSLDRRLHSAQFVGSPGAEVAVADSIVLQLLRWVHPELLARYGPRPMWSPKPAALAEFLDGEDAFRRDAWGDAARHFRQALNVDPTFARAAWRLANAQRWRRMPAGVDLHAVLARQSRFLTPLDSLLIAAELAPHGEPRYRIYQQALALFPTEPYARLLYGAELMHRGPLAGISLDSGAAVLGEAVAQDAYLAPAHDQLVWALIRLGRRDSARAALDQLKQRRRSQAEESDLSIAASLEVAFAARFTPESVPASAAASAFAQDVARTARLGLGFDVPELQLALGKRLPGPSGHEAQGLALMSLGRPVAALSHFDSAAALFATPARQLETYQWRLLPAALGIPGIPETESDDARRGLASLAAGSGPVAARAAWTGAVDAYARNDSSAGRQWRSRLRALSARERAAVGVGDLGRLDQMLAAFEFAARGNLDDALTRSRPLLAFEEWPHMADPFVRAVLHARRAEWLERRGSLDSADRALLWYENSDFAGWPSDTLQAVEIDWALATWSRWRRGVLAARSGDSGRACALLGRVLALWQRAEPSHEPLVREAGQQRQTASCKP
jgi:hypothetical protein